MKLICSCPSISMIAITVCRYYSLSTFVLFMYRFKRFLMLLVHQMFISRANSIVFRFSFFLLKLVFKDGLYSVYQLKDSKPICCVPKFDFYFLY